MHQELVFCSAWACGCVWVYRWCLRTILLPTFLPTILREIVLVFLRNLLLLAELNAKTVIGAPGCARSPAENGFDWVLQRLLCGLPVDEAYLSGLGVGGLLMEISARPQPREG